MPYGNYSQDKDSEENFNQDDKYDTTGESEFSRDSTVPYDQDEVLSERHYNFNSEHGKKLLKTRDTQPQNYRGRGPKGYRKSDEALKEDICEALYRSTSVDASQIEVKVKSGAVTLMGLVEDEEHKRLSLECIQRLAGVQSVTNDIVVKKNNDGKDPNKVSPKGLIQNITGLN